MCVIILICLCQAIVATRESERLRDQLRAAEDYLQSRENMNNIVRQTGLLHFIEPASAFFGEAKRSESGENCERLPSVQQLYQFFATYPGFGITDPLSELVHVSSTEDSVLGEGYCVFRFSQIYHNIPVLGAQVLVHVDPEGGIRFVNGVVVPLSDMTIEPILTRGEAIQAARAHWQDQQNKNFSSSTCNVRRIIWQHGLSADPVPNQLPYLAYEVTTTNAIQEEYVIILDALTGSILTSLDSIRHAIYKVWQYAYEPNKPAYYLSDRNQYPTNNAQANKLIRASADVFGVMKKIFGVNSYNKLGASMISVFDAVPSPPGQCPNAWWNGFFISACPGMAGYDVVVHEWAHAYTQFSSNLRYLGESGALNEAYSDIAAESLQLSYNKLYNQYGVKRSTFSCNPSDSVRWLIGEATTEAMHSETAMRDMWNPNCNQNPRYVGDDRYEWCGSADQGGVHTNSGIFNQLFSLVADGGSLNNVRVNAIGIDAAFSVFWRAAFVYATETSTFAQQANNIERACRDLIGRPIKNIADDWSGPALSSASCTAVSNAILATKLRDPMCTCINCYPHVISAGPSGGYISTNSKKFDNAIYIHVSGIQSTTVLCRFTIVGSRQPLAVQSAWKVFDSEGGYKTVVCSPLPSISSISVRMEIAISINQGQTWLIALSSYQLFAPPQITSVYPTNIPSQGGIVTIIGQGFESFSGCLLDDVSSLELVNCLTCRFGSEKPVAATFDNSNQLTCPFPSSESLSHSSDQYLICISKNNRIFICEPAFYITIDYSTSHHWYSSIPWETVFVILKYALVLVVIVAIAVGIGYAIYRCKRANITVITLDSPQVAQIEMSTFLTSDNDDEIALRNDVTDDSPQ